MSLPGPERARMLPLVRRHLAIGWWCLLLFLGLGLLLEGLHGLKVRWYLDVTHQTRRLMLTLAHAHGALLALIHLAYAATLYVQQRAEDARQHAASRALTAATVLLPGGFFAAGFFAWDGDPGLGIVLVPLGALALGLCVVLTALGLTRER